MSGHLGVRRSKPTTKREEFGDSISIQPPGNNFLPCTVYACKNLTRILLNSGNDDKSSEGIPSSCESFLVTQNVEPVGSRTPSPVPEREAVSQTRGEGFVEYVRGRLEFAG